MPASRGWPKHSRDYNRRMNPRRHMNPRPYRGVLPTLGERVYLDPAATLIGDVVLGDDVSLWPGVVVRGDVNFIRVGRSAEHTFELQSLMRISYAVFYLKKKTITPQTHEEPETQPSN